MRNLNSSRAWPVPQMLMRPSDPNAQVAISLIWPSLVQILLKSRPKGWPSEENFEFVEVDLQQPGKGSGDVLVQILWLSVDPYLRGRCACVLLGHERSLCMSCVPSWPAFGLHGA